MKRGRLSLIVLMVALMLCALTSVYAVCRGEWVEGPTYNTGDHVTYQGLHYECLQTHTAHVGAGWTPATQQALWTQISEAVSDCEGGPTTPPGTPTATPTPTPTPPPSTPTPTAPPSTPTPTPGQYTAWDDDSDYAVDDRVSYGGSAYECIVAHHSNEWWAPDVSPTLWTPLGAGGDPNATAAPGPGLPNKVFAPYVDVCIYPTFSLTDCYTATGQKYYTLAFIISANVDDQEPAWGGAILLDENHMMDDINNLRSQGGDIIISFGGANGTELAQSITNLSTLTATYQTVIDKYNLTYIDLDIEGAAVTHTESIDRRNKAMVNLQAANPSLKVTYCLPVLPSGLTQDGVNVLQNAMSNGVDIHCVNVMAMDYGPYEAPNGDGGMGGYAIDAANSTRSQMQSIGLSASVGITPMIGKNDVQGEWFYLDDAQEVLSWANGTSWVSLLAMWSSTRDNGDCPGNQYAQATCSGLAQDDFAFTNIFKSFSQ